MTSIWVLTYADYDKVLNTPDVLKIRYRIILPESVKYIEHLKSD